MIDDLHFTVRGSGEKLDAQQLHELQSKSFADALISLETRRDDLREIQAFEVNRPTEVELYAVGEARRDGNFDYAVVLNSDNLEIIWDLRFRDSKHAGGSEKNRLASEVLELKPGNYTAIFVTDDSHSPRSWNAAPPYDPAFWGMTINPTNNADRKNIRLKEDAAGFGLQKAIVDFTRLEDNEFRSYGFTVKKDMDVRILAVGEGKDGDMYDYGWLVDATTHERVWEMAFNDTKYAGGGNKNRIADEIVHLEKGNYIAHFVTDDSHSYREWNTSPPILEEFWGMAIVPADDSFDTKDVTAYQPQSDKNIIASIVRVRDYDRKREHFSLDKPTKVRIYAIGEGMRGGMYDYGWIENDKTGELVWEMSYRKTEHAGGAEKNRLADSIIELEAGNYTLYYETDDSHSFEEWNAAPPFDPESWGITLLPANGR